MDKTNLRPINQPEQGEMPFAIIDGESITELPHDYTFLL